MQKHETIESSIEDSVEEYIAGQDAEKQPDLLRMRAILRDALPEAEERISWSMPTFWKGHNILHFTDSQVVLGNGQSRIITGKIIIFH